jgi:hypothetical protein
LRSQPERRPGWLHGLVNHGQQLAGQGGQVDLVAEAVLKVAMIRAVS